jgi:hypothetical protein
MDRLRAAAADEDAELRALSEQAEQTRQAVAETAGALTRAITANARASVLARRVAARAASSACQNIGARRHIAVAVVPAVLVTVAAVYLLRRHPR